jgi:hypothetical protein
MDRKSDKYVRQSQNATSEIKKWPEWMQRNLTPPRVPMSGIYKPTKGGGEIALSKGDRIPPAKAGSSFRLNTPEKKKKG